MCKKSGSSRDIEIERERVELIILSSEIEREKCNKTLHVSTVHRKLLKYA